MQFGDTKECFISHMGLWAMLREPLEMAVSLARQNALPMHAMDASALTALNPLYQVTEKGDAVISLHGPFTKKASKFGGVSTIETRAALRAAANDSTIKRIVLHIDSPGGHVSGVNELAQDVRAAKQQKPTVAFIEDLGASAAYFVASQADAVFSNETANVGGLGTYMVLRDTSEQQKREGIKTVVISSGGMKGAGESGEVTPELRDYMQGLVDSFNGHFKSAVKTGRKFSAAHTDKVFNGKVFSAEDALKMGLIDGIATLDSVLGGEANFTERVQMAEDKVELVAETKATVSATIDPKVLDAALKEREALAKVATEAVLKAQTEAMTEALVANGCPMKKEVIQSTLLGVATSGGDKALFAEFTKLASIPKDGAKWDGKPSAGTVVTAESAKTILADLRKKHGYIDGVAKFIREFPEHATALRGAAK